MTKIFSLLMALVLFSGIVTAQTYNPSCYSNASGWKITKVENNISGTFVYLSVYTYKPDYEFWIHPGMYIEKYNTYGSARYKILSFRDNKLDTKYKLEPYTEYEFVLQFERIPDSWKDINIIEPQTANANSFYWKYVSLDKASTERLPLDNFFLNVGLPFFNNFAHPANQLKKYTYSIDYNTINVTMYYQECVTDLSIQFENNIVKKVKVIKDTDWLMPFFTLESLIFMGDAMFNNTTYKTEAERRLDKLITEMNGRELASFALTCAWNLYK